MPKRCSFVRIPYAGVRTIQSLMIHAAVDSKNSPTTQLNYQVQEII